MNMTSVLPPAGLVVVVALGLAAPAADADGLQAGQWRVITRVELNGMAQPPGQNLRCLSQAEVDDLERTFSAVSRTTNSACERVEFELTPLRLKWRLLCKGQLDMDVAGDFVFDTPEHYTAIITGSSSMFGRVMQATRVTIEATRVGECG